MAVLVRTLVHVERSVDLWTMYFFPGVRFLTVNWKAPLTNILGAASVAGWAGGATTTMTPE